MKGRFLTGSHEDPAEGNVYADKSALVLDWLLREGLKRDKFSLREVSEEVGISLGLMQRVFAILVSKGFVETKGVRTAKSFLFKKPKQLLESWIEHYSIMKKCKMRTYSSRLSRAELLDVLNQSKLNHKVALALHSAAEMLEVKNTNLSTLETYLLDPTIRPKLEELLQLEPKERGYDVLLIEPYYKMLLKKNQNPAKGLKISPVLLTFLDLYHFPLRGQEQAEFMATRIPELKKIYKNG